MNTIGFHQLIKYVCVPMLQRCIPTICLFVLFLGFYAFILVYILLSAMISNWLQAAGNGLLEKRRVCNCVYISEYHTVAGLRSYISMERHGRILVDGELVSSCPTLLQ